MKSVRSALEYEITKEDAKRRKAIKKADFGQVLADDTSLRRFHYVLAAKLRQGRKLGKLVSRKIAMGVHNFFKK